MRINHTLKGSQPKGETLIGTVVNTCAIILGSVIGGCIKKNLKSKYHDAIFTALGIATIALGINAAVQNMPNSQFPVLFIASLALGAIIGTALNLEERFDAAVSKHSKNGKEFAQGFSTAIMLFCIGTLSILGPINSALYGDETFLFTNAALDLVSSMVLASTFGMGIALAGLVLFLWQGGIYLLASILAPMVSGGLMVEIGIVGGILILATGINLLRLREISTMNLLPSLFIPVVWFALLSATGGFGGIISF